MKVIPINEELSKLLNDYISWFNKQNFDLPMDERRMGEGDMDYFCSSEYLDLVMENEDHKGEHRNTQRYAIFNCLTAYQKRQDSSH